MRMCDLPGPEDVPRPRWPLTTAIACFLSPPHVAAWRRRRTSGPPDHHARGRLHQPHRNLVCRPVQRGAAHGAQRRAGSVAHGARARSPGIGLVFRYLVTEVHELSLRELLLNRPTLDLDDIRLMASHFLRGLHVRRPHRGRRAARLAGADATMLQCVLWAVGGRWLGRGSLSTRPG